MDFFKKIIVLLTGGGVLCAHAQTTNQGTLTISQGTQVVSVGALHNTANGWVANDGELILRADLHNDGPFTYNDPNGDQGILRLGGSEQQRLSGSVLVELPRLVLGNPAGFANGAELSLTKEMNLMQGVFDNTDHGGQLWLDGDVAINGPSDASFVLGDVYLSEETTTLLPTGDAGQYHGLAVRSAGGAAKTFSVQYRGQNSDGLYPHAQKQPALEALATSGHWSVDRVNGTGAAQIALAYNHHLAPEVLTTHMDRLRVAYWNAQEQLWQDLGGTLNTAHKTVTSDLATDRFGVFALAISIDLTDTDGDGVPDVVENGDDPPTDPNDPNDLTDTDGDGVPDYVEGNDDPPTDPNDPNDFTDSDGDGVPDYVEENGNPPTDPNDPDDFIDTDGDGVPDYVEGNDNPPTDPNDPNDFTDTDGDGVPDYVEENGDPPTDSNNPDDFADSDGDGVPDYVEENGDPPTDSNDPDDFVDSDGDGVPDYVEENDDPPTDPNNPGDFMDTDGDGVPDYVEENNDPPTDPEDPTDFIDQDGDNLPDHIQKDKDQGDLQILHEVVPKSDPNGFFRIGRITDFPDNTFRLFNRYGVEVFTMEGYDNASRVFKGFSNTGTLVHDGSDLADGVYFYMIHYVKEGKEKKRTGYLYVTQ